MRICYVSHSDSHFTAPYVDFFAAAGHEVHLVSLHQHDLPNAINHHPMQRAFDPMKDKWAYVWAIPAVRRIVRAIKPDIVHAHYVSSNGMMAAASGAHPLVVTAHGSDVHFCANHPIKRWTMLYALRSADVVNPVSNELARKIQGLGIPPERILIATLGIDTKPFLAVKRTAGREPVHILCTRRLGPVYACDTILLAARELHRRGVKFRLTFAASGPQEAEMKAAAAEYGLDGVVHFMGGYQLAALPELLASADIYVSASRSDGTSLSLLEGMVAGAFPVVSDIPANREWLSGEGDGLLFPVGDYQQMARCLEVAIRNSSLRAAATAPNRERIVSGGDREANMRRVLRRYEQLITSSCRSWS